MDTRLGHLKLVCLRGKSDEIWVYDFVSAFLLRFNIFYKQGVLSWVPWNKELTPATRISRLHNLCY